MKYKCLIVDHDDTLVNSTATIHYPCFIEYLDKTREGVSKNYTLKEYFIKNFSPGVVELFRDELGMSEEEFLDEQRYWSEYVKNHIPTAYEGLREVLSEFKERGGMIAVASHSYEKYILRDYRHNGLVMPDAIYSWDMPPELRKPHPHTVLDIIEKYGFEKKDILVLDDLKPGYDMAKAAGVPFAAAGWANDIPQIERFMRENCGLYGFRSPRRWHCDSD